MKKIIYTLFVITMFAFGFAASDEGDTDSEDQFVGEYVVTDTEGTKWYFNFSRDKQVTVKTAGMSDDDMYYGKRGSFSRGFSQLDFSDFHAGNPPIKFPKFDTPWEDYWYITKDGWLYRGYDGLQAKNPKARLKITQQ